MSAVDCDLHVMCDSGEPVWASHGDSVQCCQPADFVPQKSDIIHSEGTSMKKSNSSVLLTYNPFSYGVWYHAHVTFGPFEGFS